MPCERDDVNAACAADFVADRAGRPGVVDEPVVAGGAGSRRRHRRFRPGFRCRRGLGVWWFLGAGAERCVADGVAGGVAGRFPPAAGVQQDVGAIYREGRGSRWPASRVHSRRLEHPRTAVLTSAPSCTSCASCPGSCPASVPRFRDQLRQLHEAIERHGAFETGAKQNAHRRDEADLTARWNGTGTADDRPMTVPASAT
jgi:hypothetical protein